MSVEIHVHHYLHLDGQLVHLGQQLIEAIAEGATLMAETVQETIGRLTTTIDDLSAKQFATDTALMAEVQQIRTALESASGGDLATLQAALDAQIQRLEGLETTLDAHKAEIEGIIPDAPPQP